MMNNEKLHMFPWAPKGANMFARYVVYHILAVSPSENASKKRLFGSPAARAIDPFGASIGKLTQKHPEFEVSAFDLLNKATLFRLYSAALAPERKHAWRSSLLEGQGRMINRFVTGCSGFRLVKQHLHFCKKCVEHDQSQYGIGYWRLVHQIPSIRLCPIHFSPLCGICKTCGKAIASENNWHPPSTKCPYCGGNTFERLCELDIPVFQRFTTLCNSAIEGDIPDLTPHRRVQIYSRHCEATPFGQILDADLDIFINEVIKQWHVPTLAVLEELLAAPMNREFVKQAICGQDHILNPIGHLALMASFPPKPLVENNAQRPKFPLSDRCKDVLRDHSIDELEVIDRLSCTAVEHGLPIITGIMLLEGATQRATFKRLGVCGSRLGRFRQALEHICFSGVKKREAAEPEPQKIHFAELIEEIREANFFAYHGRAKQDASTLGATVLLPPQYKGRSTDAMRTFCRTIISQALKEGATGRKELPFTALSWCRRFDREWLDLTVPRKKRPSIDVPQELLDKLSIHQLRRLCRKVITEAMAAGVGKRPTLPRRAADWARQHDKAWLAKLPPRKKWGPNS